MIEMFRQVSDSILLILINCTSQLIKKKFCDMPVFVYLKEKMCTEVSIIYL